MSMSFSGQIPQSLSMWERDAGAEYAGLRMIRTMSINHELSAKRKSAGLIYRLLWSRMGYLSQWLLNMNQRGLQLSDVNRAVH